MWKSDTGFSNAEEEAVQQTNVVLFLIEDEFKNLGATYSCGPNWGVYTKQDGELVTGQNPASSRGSSKITFSGCYQFKIINSGVP